jgi:threonine/homoserine/homoserine lactone efflux protein
MNYPIDTIWQLMAYAAVMTITPGPNNLLLLSSGMNFGLRRTGWHIAGILAGVLLQICVTGAGLGTLFILVPELQSFLKVAGSLYMLLLARQLWLTDTLHPASAVRTIGFGEALAFQFINPKAWIMATTVISVFVPAGENYSERVVIAGLIFVGASLPCICVWAASGAGLRSCIQNDATFRWINCGLALLSVMTAVLFWA